MWQFFESQNPEFYRNFAVYGQSLACLHKANYWSLTSIVEDGMQYWRSYFWWDGFFRIIHTPAICEMDLVDEKNLYRTIRSQYKQLRRWSWGCTDIEYVLPQFIANKKIPTWEKIRKTVYLVYNHLFWAGWPFMLFFIGYVPGIFSSIDHSLATFTVPIASSLIFTMLFATVIIPSILSIHIMRRYTHFTPLDYVWNMVQWITVPILTLTLFLFPLLNLRYDSFWENELITSIPLKKWKENLKIVNWKIVPDIFGRNPTHYTYYMFESYQLEVMRKRRAARIFWLIVFISALFLYFFFQGYYPNVRLGLKRIFMENWGSNFTGSTDIFHPFGIINVRTTQTDATILLNDGYYGNNEKRVSDYGKYAMEISKDWYLTNNLIFIIDREKTFL